MQTHLCRICLNTLEAILGYNEQKPLDFENLQNQKYQNTPEHTLQTKKEFRHLLRKRLKNEKRKWN